MNIQQNNINMSQSPRRRILTEIGTKQQQFQREHALSMNKFNSFDRIFKFSPTIDHRMSAKKIADPQNCNSRFKHPVDCLQQLNTLFKTRKIGSDQIFFEDKLKNSNLTNRSKQKINEDIQHSIQYISNLRKNRNLFAEPKIELKPDSLAKNENKNLIETIGLELQLPNLKSRNINRERYLTQPALFQPNLKSKKKKKQQIGLYSYLQRDFLAKKDQDLTENKIIDYAKNPNNRNFHRMILQKSRKFLKKTIEQNYRQMSNIKNVVSDESKKLIEQEIKSKKQKYDQDYHVRRNVPYFSFLSLSKKQKQSVLRAVHRKQSAS